MLTSLGFNYYANAKSISPEFYQKLVNRCWRRSGTLMYRPNQRSMCCPHYTIRTDTKTFTIKKDQRQTINKFNKFILGQEFMNREAKLHPRSKEEAKQRDNEFILTERIHEAEQDRLSTTSTPAHSFTVTLEKDVFTEEKFEVYDNYQNVIHKDKPDSRTKEGFTQFLCNSPLRRGTVLGEDGRERQIGSFHQCYRIDGKLVAIGVLDLLPDCVSSVYFLYHESIHQHAPGKLAALRELSFAKEAGYRWWYPGYYIHDCPKMRYKADYQPLEMLDPVSLEWNVLDDSLLKMLDKKAFVSKSLEDQATETTETKTDDEVTATSHPTPPSGLSTTDDDASDSDEDFASQSLFDSNMPGITCLQDFADIDLDHIAVRLRGAPRLFETSDLVDWETSEVGDGTSLKSLVAEMVSAMGPDCIDDVCLDLT